MKLKNGFALHDVWGEKVLIAQGIDNINFSKLINLNPTAAYLWEQASEGEATAESLAEQLTKEYDVDYAQALSDTQALIQQWGALNLIDE
jgi:hypothetical protein